jgi:hypothetical protein
MLLSPNIRNIINMSLLMQIFSTHQWPNLTRSNSNSEIEHIFKNQITRRLIINVQDKLALIITDDLFQNARIKIFETNGSIEYFDEKIYFLIPIESRKKFF